MTHILLTKEGLTFSNFVAHCHVLHIYKGQVIIYDREGARRKTTFYWEIIRCPLAARTKIPWPSRHRVIIFRRLPLRTRGENFLEKNISMPTLAHKIFFPSPLSVKKNFFLTPPPPHIFLRAPLAINNPRSLLPPTN